MLALLEKNAAEAEEEAIEIQSLLGRRSSGGEYEEDSVVTQLDSIFDDGAGTDEVRIISGWQDLPPLPTVAPPRRRGIGAFALAVAVIMSMGVLAFGAMSWLQRCEPENLELVAIEDSRIGELRKQEQELIALRLAHLATIEDLEARIAALDEEGDPDSQEQLTELTAALAEMKAEAHALEVAAELIGKKKQSASASATPGANPEQAQVAEAAPVVPEAPVAAGQENDGPVEENPYGDVSLASVLEGAVGEEAFETGSEKAGSGENGAIENLIEQAVKGPSEGAGKKNTDGKNTLPDDVIELPLAPSRASVRKVLGSMKPAIRRCGGEPYQRLVVEVTVVGSTGRVVSARTIDADHAGTPVGVCAAQAVKLARFPKFQKDKMVIKYPFDL